MRSLHLPLIEQFQMRVVWVLTLKPKKIKHEIMADIHQTGPTSRSIKNIMPSHKSVVPEWGNRHFRPNAIVSVRWGFSAKIYQTE